MSVIWSGVTEQGAIVPVQVDETGKVLATVGPDGGYVRISGDVMTGPLFLSGDPDGALQAATKRYVDSATTSAMPFAMGNFFYSYGVKEAININSVRAKSDGVWEFYFENIPQSTEYVVVTSSASRSKICRIEAREVLYFSIKGFNSQDLTPSAEFGCSFVVWEAPQAIDVRISE